MIGDAPDRRVEILGEHEALHATWSRFGPRRDGADLHVHRHHSDLFYVLAGELTVRLGPAGEPAVARAGTLVRVPPLVVHGFRNGGDQELRYLNLHAPGRRFADYLRSLRDGRRFSYDQEPPPEDGGRSPAEAVVGGAVATDERPGERRTVLADVPEIRVTEVETNGGGDAVAAHDRQVRGLYVLDGELTVTTGDREVHAPTGSWVQIDPGTAHAVTARGRARFLDVRAPAA